jgi:hypothetical protein
MAERFNKSKYLVREAAVYYPIVLQLLFLPMATSAYAAYHLFLFKADEVLPPSLSVRSFRD